MTDELPETDQPPSETEESLPETEPAFLDAWSSPDQGQVQAASQGWNGFWAVWCFTEDCFVGSIWFDEQSAQRDAIQHSERYRYVGNPEGHRCRATYVEMGTPT
jgi:hypothetical protein